MPSLPSDWKCPYPCVPQAPLAWDALAAEPWIQAMQGVPQSPVYHAEGDVHIHTRMVLEALLGLPGYAALNAQQQGILFMAAALHDVAKPVCTRTEADGSIVSPKHAVVGRQMARQLLYEAGQTPFEVREAIAQLVRHHGLPLWFMERADMVAHLRKVAEVVDMPLLALLAEADVRGRICDDQEDLLTRVELFRESCQEHGCWEGPFAFPSAVARYEYFRDPAQGPYYEPFGPPTCTVSLMVGLPGSGKDTWIAREAGHLPVISLDDIRQELGMGHTGPQGAVVQLAKERARGYLRAGQDFVWNATNVRPDIRRPLISLFREYQASTRLVYVEVPFRQHRLQNTSREAVVPEKALERMYRGWEVPEPWEAQEIIWEVQA